MSSRLLSSGKDSSIDATSDLAVFIEFASIPIAQSYHFGQTKNLTIELTGAGLARVRV